MKSVGIATAVVMTATIKSYNEIWVKNQLFWLVGYGGAEPYDTYTEW